MPSSFTDRVFEIVEINTNYHELFFSLLQSTYNCFKENQFKASDSANFMAS